VLVGGGVLAGMPDRGVVFAIDLSERKKSDEAILRRDQLLHTMFQSLSSHVVVLNSEGIITYASRSWDQFGKDQNGAVGRLSVGTNYLTVCRRAASQEDGSAKQALDGIREVLAGRLKTYSLEYPCDVPDGTRWFAMQVDPMPRDHGGVVISHNDVTERRQAEEALRNALAEVQRLKERVEADNVYLREELSETHRYGEIVGESEGMKKVLRQVGQVAVTDMTVLVLGETGTGKELVARAIHAGSARRGRPLVKVNCSALPAELMESELFGHEKGAFTGAVSKRVGRFELADGGTIFLDEIGDLALGLQAKLLRVLQEGEFERLGSSKTVRVNVRVIAATNRDLSEAMRREAFRSDLYYRLAVYPIQIPALRERKGDIGMLAQAFLKESSRRLGRPFGALPRRVLESLQRYDWPGNVRELQNVIERATVTSAGSILELPEEWRAEGHFFNQEPAQPAVVDAPLSPAGFTLEELERAHIVEVLNQTRWRIEGVKGAAVVLGLHPSTLRSRMSKLGISRSEPVKI
jgi:transcriptional regulator with GAF, ATPase, and Fis domain